jgi:subtilisin family serine protease
LVAAAAIANVEAVMTETDRLYTAGTVEHSATRNELFSASGKKSGHGTIAWLPAPSYEMHDSPPWRGLPGRPVIALLDSGVQPHEWLPGGGGQPFVLDAKDFGWPGPALENPPATGQFGSHWGHATFIAGLIRLTAPDALVLSMRVMNSYGKVSENDAAAALTWLAGKPEIRVGSDYVSVDIVLMAFGRQADPGDDDLEKLRTPIRTLSGLGVRIVASAGNDGAERPVYPAAFAAERELSHKSKRTVVSVGALATPTERAPYSNSGPWVTKWRKGTSILSIMPLTTKSNQDPRPGFDPIAAPSPGDGFAWWSGTSFAAAVAAGHLAAGLPAYQALPEPAARS